jgi:hypothetical protein
VDHWLNNGFAWLIDPPYTVISNLDPCPGATGPSTCFEAKLCGEGKKERRRIEEAAAAAEEACLLAC